MSFLTELFRMNDFMRQSDPQYPRFTYSIRSIGIGGGGVAALVDAAPASRAHVDGGRRLTADAHVAYCAAHVARLLGKGIHFNKVLPFMLEKILLIPRKCLFLACPTFFSPSTGLMYSRKCICKIDPALPQIFLPCMTHRH